MKRLQNKVAVVTGGASGIGKETSLLLAKEGCDLALADINEDGLRETAGLVEKIGRKASTHVVDVSDIKRMEAFSREVSDTHGHVHILMNNAGVNVSDIFKDGDLEDFKWIVGINMWGVIYGCKFFMPYLIKEDEAHIINISSMFGLAGVPGQSAYCTTKYAVRGFTESLRAELHETGIHVTCVHPGVVDTDVARSGRFRDNFDGSTREEFVKQFSEAALTKPEQAASAIVKGIMKNRKRILIGSDAYFFDIITRLLPVSYQKLMMKLLSRKSK